MGIEPTFRSASSSDKQLIEQKSPRHSTSCLFPACPSSADPAGYR